MACPSRPSTHLVHYALLVARAAMLTGRLPIRNGFYSDNSFGKNAYAPQLIVDGLSLKEKLFSVLLKQKGYRNKLIGKWHLGHHADYLPSKRGFHEWMGSPNCHFGPYDDKKTPNMPVFKNEEMVGRFYEEYKIDLKTGESNLTQIYTQEAIDFISEQKSSPFLLYFAVDSTHQPVYASKTFLGRSKRGRYGDAVMELDWSVGQILNALDSVPGLRSNTLVVFSSDNGAALVGGTRGGSNAPFLCGKETTFEGGQRVPFIASWPGTIAENTVDRGVGTLMDLFPTILEIAEIKPHPLTTLDGWSLMKRFNRTAKQPDRPMFFYRGNALMAVRLGSYKMHLWTWATPQSILDTGVSFCPGQYVKNVTTITQVDYRKRPLVFNVDSDPGEKFMISFSSKEYSDVRDRLTAVVNLHLDLLVPGNPALNLCDRAAMNWAPPGCEKIGKCLKAPPSKPYKCNWDH